MLEDLDSCYNLESSSFKLIENYLFSSSFIFKTPKEIEIPVPLISL